MQPSASSGAASCAANSGGGAIARGFNGKKFGVSRPTKFQLVGGKGKNVAGKGTKSNK